MKKILLIANPKSGKSSFLKHENKIKKLLSHHDLTLYYTKGKNDATQYCTNNAHLFDVIISCGGDGTFNEIVNGLMKIKKELRPTVLILPLGTVNDQSKQFKYPKKIDKIIKMIDENKSYYIDICKVNNLYFSYICATGFLCQVSYATPSSLKRKIGKFAYIHYGFKSLFNNKRLKLQITTDNNKIINNYYLILILLTRRFAGLNFDNISNNKFLDDGQVSIRAFRASKIMLLMHIVLFVLTLGLYKFKQDCFNSKHIEIKSLDKQDFIWTLDGEKGPIGDITIDVFNKEIPVIVSKKVYKKFKG